MIVNISKLYGLPEKIIIRRTQVRSLVYFFLQILEDQPSMIRYRVNWGSERKKIERTTVNIWISYVSSRLKLFRSFQILLYILHNWLSS